MNIIQFLIGFVFQILQIINLKDILLYMKLIGNKTTYREFEIAQSESLKSRVISKSHSVKEHFENYWAFLRQGMMGLRGLNNS